MEEKNALKSNSGTKIEANSRKSGPNHSAEEKNARDSVPCNKNISSRNSVPNQSAEEKKARNSIPCNKNRSKLSEFCPAFDVDGLWGMDKSFCYQLPYFGCFFKLIFSAYFCSIPSFGIDSSVDAGMPRNENFLLWNNGNRSESTPRNFFGTKYHCQPGRTCRPSCRWGPAVGRHHVRIETLQYKWY
jgi:hypothetical protein